VSNLTEVAEDLLTYFVVIGNRECFAAILYACFDLLRSDIVMDLSWQHGLNNSYMPYRIQQQRSMLDKAHFLCPNFLIMPNFTNYKKMATLEKEVKERAKKDSVKERS